MLKPFFGIYTLNIQMYGYSERGKSFLVRYDQDSGDAATIAVDVATDFRAVTTADVAFDTGARV